ncbi:hypothetical protein P8452_23740 [Trifolium repens]|nr:hypothetical protein P8452_23740 [Trifolium repens]
MAEALICTQNWLRAPSFSQPEGQNTQEELETSEKIVRELCQSLASTTFGGVAGPSAISVISVLSFLGVIAKT